MIRVRYHDYDPIFSGLDLLKAVPVVLIVEVAVTSNNLYGHGQTSRKKAYCFQLQRILSL